MRQKAEQQHDLTILVILLTSGFYVGNIANLQK